jgi:hypothetical protein
MTISDELYNKYKIKQEQSYNELNKLGDKYNGIIEMLKMPKLPVDKDAVAKELNSLTKKIGMYCGISEALREFLHEIAMENKEKTNEQR